MGSFILEEELSKQITPPLMNSAEWRYFCLEVIYDVPWSFYIGLAWAGWVAATPQPSPGRRGTGLVSGTFHHLVCSLLLTHFHLS